MQTRIYITRAKEPQHSLPTKPKPRSATECHPEPSSLTREELRKIIIDLIG